MTQRKTTSRGKHRKSQPQKSFLRKIWRVSWKLALAAGVILIGYMVYLDAIVQSKFSGKRWTVPAKVYARPLELYAGLPLKQEDFLIELTALGYRKGQAVKRPGDMQVNGNSVELYSRGFKFYDGTEPAQQVRVRFSQQQVAEIQAAGQALPILRLEPLTIGGIYPAHQEDRILIQLKDAPAYLVESLLAVEDRNFFSHHGVSPRGIARAVWVNAQGKKMRQGGSTLTQQLVKNFFLTNERTLSRKANEALMSILLELHYGKEEILEAYLNEVFLGQDGSRAIHGFGLASQYYFGQPFAELEVQQVALLVGMVQGPSGLNPRRNPEAATTRRNLVLDLLAQQGTLTAEEAATAKAKGLGVTQRGSLADTTYPGFMDLVKRQLREDYRDEDLTNEGLRVFTSFDPILQRKAEQAISDTYKRLAGRSGLDKLEAAMLVTNPETGEVQALLGSKAPRYSGYNRALDASRPIGSLVKPAIYLTALQRPEQFTLTTLLQDTNLVVQGKDGSRWSPKNYDRREHGEVFLYQALAKSYNLSTARLGMAVGIGEVLDTVRKLGAAHQWPAYPSMMLGAGDLTPFQVTSMYQTLANGGFNTPLRAIRDVLTADNQPLNRYQFTTEQRFDPGAVFLTQQAMQKAMREGTGRSAYQQVSNAINLAGKTGTSNDLRDSWFAGFSQNLLAVVWMGQDDNGKTAFTGASGALQLWSSFMAKANLVSLNPVAPSNITYAWVNSKTGEGTEQGCPNAVKMPYILGSDPAPVPCWNTENIDNPATNSWLHDIFN